MIQVALLQIVAVTVYIHGNLSKELNVLKIRILFEISIKNLSVCPALSHFFIF